MEAELRGPLHDDSYELLESIIALGGLPSRGSKHRKEASGEIERVEEAYKNSNRKEKRPMVGMFSQYAKSLDTLREELNARGFDFETGGEVLEALEDRLLRQRPVFNSRQLAEFSE